VGVGEKLRERELLANQRMGLAIREWRKMVLPEGYKSFSYRAENCSIMIELSWESERARGNGI